MLRNNIKKWIKSYEACPPLGYEIPGWKPTDYSVDEWETYLKAKSKSLNFRRFLRSPRWKIRPDVDRSLYLECLREGKKNALEFLSDHEIDYIKDLLIYLSDLMLKADTLRETLANPLGPGEYNDTLRNFRETLEKYRFCCRWKYNPERPEKYVEQLNMISEYINESLEKRRILWEEVCSCKEPFDPNKIRFYRYAVLYGAIGATSDHFPDLSSF